jgi:hypothetical protein
MQSAAKHPCIYEIKKIQRSFVVPLGGTPQDDSSEGFSAAKNLLMPPIKTFSVNCGALLLTETAEARQHNTSTPFNCNQPGTARRPSKSQTEAP